MQIKKRGSVYHYRFQVKGERFTGSTGTANRQQALAIAMDRWQEAKDRARGILPMQTLAEARTAWLETHAATASIGHFQNVERWDPLDLGDVMLDRLSTELVEGARNRFLQGRSPATANGWLRILNLLGNEAVRLGRLATIPWRVKMLKVQRRPRPTLPVAKVKAYLAALDAHNPQVGTAARLMIGLGLRESEALAARWEWLDQARATYTVGKAKGKEARVLPAPPWLLQHLQKAPQTLGYIIPGPEGQPHPRGFTRKGFAAANKAVKVPGLSPHRLRGTFATLHTESGTPLQVVQAMLGHKKIETTMAYVEAHLEAAKAGQDRVAQSMGFKRGRRA